MNSKTLAEIESTYIKDIVVYFCFEYYKMYLKDPKINLSEKINNQVSNRLSNIIHDWKIQIDKDYWSKSEIRDNLISNILDGDDIKYPPIKFSFFYTLSRGTEVKIIDIVVQL
jgi:hypothetical protein